MNEANMVQKETVQKQTEGPDRGWSWIIVIAAFTITFILRGIYRSAGTMLVAFMDEFKLSREEASRPIFIHNAVVDLTGIIAGPLGQRFGIRPTSIAGALIASIGVSICYFANSISFISALYGVIFGFGTGLIYTLMPVIVNQYFVNYAAIAIGIANAGASCGFVLFPIMYQYFVSTYHLNGCFLLTGGIILQLVISAALMRPPPWLKTVRNDSDSENRNHTSNGNRNHTSNGNKSVLESYKIVLTCPMFYVIALTAVIFYTFETIFFAINVDYYHDNSIDDKYIRLMSIIFTAADLIGSLCFGWITDRKFLRRSQFIMICIAIEAVVFFAFPFAKHYVLITLLSTVYGMLLGCTLMTFFVLPVDYLEPEVHAVAYGCIAFFSGAVQSASPTVIGYFRDYLGSYTLMFFIMGAISAFSSLLWLLERCFVKKVTIPADDEFHGNSEKCVSCENEKRY